MNKYVSPSLEVLKLSIVDIIMASVTTDESIDCENEMPAEEVAI